MSKKTNEIRKRIKTAEEKKGGKLTKKEIQKIERKVILKYRRKNFIRGAFLALSITIGAGGHALLTSGDKIQDNSSKQKTEIQLDNENETNNVFKNELKVDVNTISQEGKVNYEETLKQIIEEYNEKYSTDLSSEDINYIKSNPQFLGISDNGTYIQNYKQNTPVEKYISDGINDIYIMINNKNNTIITSLGEVDGKIQNIDTKVVMDSNRNEYFESDKKIDLTDNKKQEQIEEIYDTLRNEYKKEVEQER